MRVTIPLMPIVVEVRWRRLPRFRVKLRSLMIGVVLAGLFFALMDLERRTAGALNYHNTQMSMAAHRAPIGLTLPGDLSPLDAWHLAKAKQYRADFDRLDILTFLAFMTFASLAAVTAFGRALDWLSRRLRNPTGDGQPDSRPISPENPHPKPEEHRP